MTTPKKSFVVYNKIDDDFLFNDRNQTHKFPTLIAAKKAIKEYLEEPVAYGDNDKVITMAEDSCLVETDFVIYKWTTK